MKPQLAALARKHGDKVVVLKVNVDRQKVLAAKAGVRSIPDRRLYLAGRQLERAVGGTSSQGLEKMVMKHAGKLSKPTTASAERPVVASGGTRQPAGADDGSRASRSAPQDQPKAGTITPMPKDWLPEGVTPVR